MTITQGALQLAATKMREESLANSRLFKGISDGVTTLTNTSYDANSFGIGGGVNISGEALGQKIPNPNKPIKAQTVSTATTPTYQGMGYGTDKDNNHSQTTSGIGTHNITITNQDKQNSKYQNTDSQNLYTNITTDDVAENKYINGIISNNFDKNKVQQEITLQQQVTFTFGQNAPKAVAEISDYAITKILNNPNLTTDEKLAETKKWAEGGIYRIALHTLTGILATGTVQGAITTGSVAAAAPYINKLEEKLIDKLIAKGINKNDAEAAAGKLTSLVLLTAGVAIGADTSATATALNVDAFNRQLHANMGEAWVIEELYKRQGGNKKWSREQIANALRAANFKKGSFYENADSHNAVPSNRPDLGYDNLVGVQWNNHGTGISLNCKLHTPLITHSSLK
ncbi:hypothetical protein [Moraxella cuniculi]|uniref:Uncharacterized protein n=1 Tax=Moraxella cuniculi TaxID=34061 RepID=A0A3S4RL96_9GAMM|nr:hypothetical protein [Moraxella cuniculi]VEG13333.1 Uncharacterised protein [Moraxella cuniculi]